MDAVQIFQPHFQWGGAVPETAIDSMKWPH